MLLFFEINLKGLNALKAFKLFAKKIKLKYDEILKKKKIYFEFN